MKKVLIASNNPGKVREIGRILAETGIQVADAGSYPLGAVEETGLTFIENALLKARHASRVSGLPAIADDSGLEVDVLLGRPGIYSARFAGPDASDLSNNQKLLDAVAQFKDQSLSARFRCVMVLLRHPEDPSPLIGEGVWEGHLLREPRGTQGFGYDPLFDVGQGVSAAELSLEEKNMLSHRGKAIRALVAGLLQSGYAT